MMECMIELVDPRGLPTETIRHLAGPRTGPLVRVGFLCNEAAHLSGPHFEGYTRVLETALRDRFGVVEIRREVKPTLSRPADDAMIGRLSDCDGVINGLAK
jgi:hypothetical protein